MQIQPAGRVPDREAGDVGASAGSRFGLHAATLDLTGISVKRGRGRARLAARDFLADGLSSPTMARSDTVPRPDMRRRTPDHRDTGSEETMSRELLTAEQIELQERARKLADEVMRPVAAKYDVAQEYPWEVQKAIKKAGLSGVWIPKEYGGLGGGVLDLCLVVEEFSRACGGMGVGYAVNALGSFPILVGGTDEQKQRWLPGIAAGDALVAFGLS